LHGARAGFSDFTWSVFDAHPDWFAVADHYLYAQATAQVDIALATMRKADVGPDMGLSQVMLGFIALLTHGREEGLAILSQSVETLRRRGSAGDLAFALTYLAGAEVSAIRLEEAARHSDEALAISRQLQNRLQVARLTIMRGSIVGMGGGASVVVDRARMALRTAELREGLAVLTSVGALNEAAQALGVLADEYDSVGDYATSMQFNREARAMLLPLNDPGLLHGALSWEALAATRLGRYHHARECRLQSMEISRPSNDPFMIAWNSWELGDIARQMGDLASCRSYWADAERLFTEQNVTNGLVFVHRGWAELALRAGDLARARAEYEESLRLAEVDRHIWSRAFAHAGLARVALLAAQGEEARRHGLEALRLGVEMENLGLELIALQALGGLSLLEGALGRALEISAHVVAQPATWHEFRTLAVAVEASALQLLPAGEAEAARLRGAQATTYDLATSLLGGAPPRGPVLHWDR
jgi:tetratricopeptide (TPR) repeat protein